MTESRIDPLGPPYTDPIAAQLKRWMPPNAPMEPLALFRMLVRHEPLSDRLRGLGGLFLGKPSVSLRERELVILRACWRCGAEYEWGVHVTGFAAAVGLDEATVAATTHAQPQIAEVDALLLRLVDELHAHSTLSDALWEQVHARFTDEQVLELLALTGFYHLLSFMMNATKLPLEPWAACFP